MSFRNKKASVTIFVRASPCDGGAESGVSAIFDYAGSEC